MKYTINDSGYMWIVKVPIDDKGFDYFPDTNVHDYIKRLGSMFEESGFKTNMDYPLNYVNGAVVRRFSVTHDSKYAMSMFLLKCGDIGDNVTITEFPNKTFA